MCSRFPTNQQRLACAFISIRIASPINLSARADIPMTMHSFPVLLMSIG
jgi:hypothetical protein